MLRGVAIATNFVAQFAVTGFVWTIATRQSVMEGALTRVIGRQNADIADALYLRDVAMATIFSIFWLYRVHIGATSWIQLNDLCTAAMRPLIKLLWLLVVSFTHVLIVLVAPGKYYPCPTLCWAVQCWMCNHYGHSQLLLTSFNWCGYPEPLGYGWVILRQSFLTCWTGFWRLDAIFVMQSG